MSPHTKVSPGPDVLATSFQRHLRASNAAPRTIQSYTEAVTRFRVFLDEHGMPADAASITREHVELYLEDVLTRHKPTTALARYKSLQQLLGFLVDEGEITDSPMARMRPRVPEQPPAVLTHGRAEGRYLRPAPEPSRIGATPPLSARSSTRVTLSPE